MFQVNYVCSENPHLADGCSQQPFLGLAHSSSMGWLEKISRHTLVAGLTASQGSARRPSFPRKPAQDLHPSPPLQPEGQGQPWKWLHQWQRQD